MEIWKAAMKQQQGAEKKQRGLGNEKRSQGKVAMEKAGRESNQEKEKKDGERERFH